MVRFTCDDTYEQIHPSLKALESVQGCTYTVHSLLTPSRMACVDAEDFGRLSARHLLEDGIQKSLQRCFQDLASQNTALLQPQIQGSEAAPQPNQHSQFSGECSTVQSPIPLHCRISPWPVTVAMGQMLPFVCAAHLP